MKRTGPDSVASWVAALWGGFVGLVLFGMVRLSGMLFVASMEAFGVDRNQASLPYVLCDCTQALIGPATGFCAWKFGTRPVLIFGSLIAAIGIGANFFAQSIESVTFWWGIIFGAGFGFCCPVFPLIITQHFVKKRATAIGIMYMGSYLGISILPSVLEYLIDNYGLHGTFLWLAGMVLQCVPVSMLLKPPRNEQADTDETPTMNHQIGGQMYVAEKYIARKNSLVDIGDSVRRSSRKSKNVSITPMMLSVRTLNTIEENPEKIPPPTAKIDPECHNGSEVAIGDSFPVTSCDVIKKGLVPFSCKVNFHPPCASKFRRESQILADIGRRLSMRKMKPSSAFKVVLEPIFLLVLLSTAVFTSSFIAFMTVIVDYVRDVGLDVTAGKYVILGFSVASNVGLVGFGWVTDGGYMSLTTFSGVMFLARGLTTALLTVCDNFPVLMVTCMVQGMCEASNFNVLPLIIADYYREDVHEVAISCSFVLSGPLHLAIPSLISFFRDGWGSYNYLFYTMSSASFLCSILLFMAPLLTKCRCGRDDAILRDRENPVSAVMA